MDIAQEIHQNIEIKWQSWLNHVLRNFEKPISSHIPEKSAEEILRSKIDLKEACLEQIYRTEERIIREEYNRKLLLISPGIRFDQYTSLETKIAKSTQRLIDDIYNVTVISIHDIFSRATNNSQIRKCFRSARTLINVELHREELVLRNNLIRIQLYNRSKTNRSFFVSSVKSNRKCKNRKVSNQTKVECNKNNIENLIVNFCFKHCSQAKKKCKCIIKNNAIRKKLILSVVEPTDALILLQLVNWKYRKRKHV